VYGPRACPCSWCFDSLEQLYICVDLFEEIMRWGYLSVFQHRDQSSLVSSLINIRQAPYLTNCPTNGNVHTADFVHDIPQKWLTSTLWIKWPGGATKYRATLKAAISDRCIQKCLRILVWEYTCISQKSVSRQDTCGCNARLLAYTFFTPWR
jgi:hypothetical protein